MTTEIRRHLTFYQTRAFEVASTSLNFSPLKDPSRGGAARERIYAVDEGS
jgi:hypothetical protein